MIKLCRYLSIPLTLLGCQWMPTASAQEIGREELSRFALPSPAEEAGLPGEGALRRYEGYVTRWPEFRAKWSQQVEAKTLP